MPLEYRQLRAWVDRLQALKDMRQQEANRVEAHHAAKQEELVASPPVRSSSALALDTTSGIIIIIGTGQATTSTLPTHRKTICVG